jgi:hypothetical protein
VETSKVEIDHRARLLPERRCSTFTAPGKDIRTGDDLSVSALVTSGVVARYHLLPNGKRQYLSLCLPATCLIPKHFSPRKWIMTNAQ